MKIKYKILSLISLLVIITTLFFSFICYYGEKKILLTGLDEKLLTAAYFAKNILPEDYHDKIVDKHSVSTEEYRKIVDIYNQLCLKLGLQYIWSLININDQIIFTSSTSTNKNNPQGEHALFFETHTNPDAYKNAFTTMQTQYSTFYDKWGQGRMVLVPYFDSKGRRYLFAASMSIDDINMILKKRLIILSSMSGIIIFIGMILTFLLASSLSKPIVQIANAAKTIGKGNFDAEIKVSSKDELGMLASTLNKMVADLKNLTVSRNELSEEMNIRILDQQHVEAMVRDKTAELQKEIEVRKQAEESLKESEQKYRELVQYANSIILRWDPDGKIKFLNDFALQFLGYSKSEIIGKNIISPIVPKNESTGRDLVFIIKDITENPEKYESTENENICNDGKRVWISWSNKPIIDNNGQLVEILSVGNDITERKRMEEILQQSQKMEAIGTLAGGIAHDFNNILGGILGYTELAQDDAGKDSPVQESLVEILKSTMRARALVKQILTFSRKSQEERKPVLLYPVIQEAVKLLRSTIPTTIEIKQKINGTTGMVNADSTQMHQIVMNLCTNAAHAMPETEGVLEIELSSVVITQESMREYNDISPGPFLELKISDTGTGIDSKIINRISEPFFTTKDKEKGTGMGLAVVHGIVKDHGGDINIDSQLGKGTTFSIVLPQVIAEPDNEEDSSSEIQTGNEHILFVDDEQVLIDIGKRTLESLGYTVTAKNSSIEALEAFQQAPDEFDVIITDQTMPYMTGYNLAKRILEIKPSINIILCTGYSDTISLEKAEAAGIKALIYKPISKKEIAQEIRGVLDKHNHEYL